MKFFAFAFLSLTTTTVAGFFFDLKAKQRFLTTTTTTTTTSLLTSTKHDRDPFPVVSKNAIACLDSSTSTGRRIAAMPIFGNEKVQGHLIHHYVPDCGNSCMSFQCRFNFQGKTRRFVNPMTPNTGLAFAKSSDEEDEVYNLKELPAPTAAVAILAIEDLSDHKIDHDKCKNESVSWLDYRWLVTGAVGFFGGVVVITVTVLFLRKSTRKPFQTATLKYKHKTRGFIPLLLLALVLSPFILVSALNVTNLIVDSPVTWTAADNPISVSGKVEIVTDGILTLQEGVQVWFEFAESGIVNSGGTLLILGQPSAHVVLQPRNMSGTWQGISFGPLAVSALFVPDSDTIVQYQGGSIIQHADIVKAGTSSLAALDFDYGAAPYLSNVELVECRGRWSSYNVAIWMKSLEGYFVADYVKLSKETLESTYRADYGLMAYGVSSSAGFLLLRHFEAPSQVTNYPIYLQTLQSATVLDSWMESSYQVSCSSIKRIIFARNTISAFNNGAALLVSGCDDVTVQNSFMVGYVYLSGVSMGLTFDGNIVSASSGASVALYAYYISGSSSIRDNSVTRKIYIYWIQDVVVSGNDIQYGPLSVLEPVGNLTVSNNTIRDSMIGALEIGGYSYSSASFARVQNNTVMNCSTTNPSTAVVYLRSSWNNFRFIENRVVQSLSAGNLLRLDCLDDNNVSACSFEYNIIEDTYAVQAMLWFENYPWKFENNLFLNSISPISVLIGSSSRLTTKDVVRLPANYWGLLQDDIRGPRMTVSDAFTLSEGPMVDFVSVLTGPSTSSPLEAVVFPEGNLTDGTVGGLLAGNTLFELHPGNYTCSLSFIVRDNATLVISGDVHLAFESLRGIILHDGGTIVTSGNDTKPVLLSNASALFWKGIIVNTDVGTSISNVQITMSDIAVEHRGFGLLVLESIAVSTTKRDCVWSKSKNASIAGAVLIHHSDFNDCGIGGLVIEQRNVAEVVNSSIVRAGGTGIKVYRVFNMTVQDSRVEQSLDYALYLYLDSWHRSVYHVTNNVFIATNGGIWLTCSYGVFSARIKNNLIQGDFKARSGRYAIYLAASQGSDDVVIQENRVEAWNLVGTAALDLQFAAADSTNAGLHVTGNFFRNISASNILSLSYYSTQIPSNVGNIFSDSLKASSTSQSALVLIRNWPGGTGPKPTMHGNVFLNGLRNDTARYYIQVLQTASVATIDASRSFWGNDSEDVLVDRIFDGKDNPALATIQYLPVLLTADPDGPVGPNETSLGFLRPGGILSGILASDKSVNLTRGNYTCMGSLTIDGMLFIEAGVHIQMDHQASLMVRSGSLSVIGSVDDPVVFSSDKAGSWGQIKLEPNVTDAQDLHMANVIISGAGFSSLPALHTKRASKLINVSITECLDSGLAVEGNFGVFVLQGAYLTHSGTGSYNMKISGSGDAFVKDSRLSSQCSVELAAYDSVRLFVANVDIHPRAYYHTGLYAVNNFSDIEYLYYNASLSGGCAIQLTRQQHFEMRHSKVIFGRLGAQIGEWWYSYSSGSVYFYENTWVGNGQNNYQPISVNNLQSFVMNNNTLEHMACQSDCFYLDAVKLELKQNRFDFVKVSNRYSFLKIDSSLPSITDNRFQGISGYAGVELVAAPSFFNFTRNAWVNISSLEFYVKTTTLYENFVGGVYRIPGNFWDTDSFELLRSKTYDSQHDSELVTILHSDICIDANCEIFLSAPQIDCVDLVSMRITCIMSEEVTVIVPAGLYFAPRSIIVRHPKALLVFNAGARVMFPPGASIRVDAGTIKALGTELFPVVLTSTERFSVDYGNPSIMNWTEWGGIWLGQNSGSTVMISDAYVDGPVLQDCVIENAGFNSFSAAVYMKKVSVLLERVSIIGSGSNGVFFDGTLSPALLRKVTVSKSASSGLYLTGAQARFTLNNVNISDSQYGFQASVRDLTISSCSFRDNKEWHVLLWSSNGELDVRSSVFAGAKGGLQIQSGNARLTISDTYFSAMQRPLSIQQVTLAAIYFSQFISNVCTDRDCNCMDINWYQNCSFIGNVVKDNAAGRILQLRSGYYSNPLTEVAGNVFQNNRAATATSGSNAVVAMTSYSASQWYVNGNDFTNPASGFDMTTYGYGGSDPAKVIVNATNNLFGYPEGAGEVEISARIFDFNDDLAKPQVAFIPFLPTNYTPVCVDNCNGFGACIFPGYCVCELGWSGASCQMPTCQSLDFCNDNGECIGFDNCRCTDGWLGLSCSIANCSDRNRCAGNGFCSAPNVCSCYSELGYTGANCDECLPDYRLVGGKCQKCPPCKSGTCDNEAKCVCHPNFEGALCDRCKDGYFGGACQPYPFIETVVPNESRDVGGTTLVVKGMNLGLANASSIFRCLFGVASVDATLIADNTLRCVSPSVTLTSSSFTTSLHIGVDSSTTFNSVPFTFYGLCPEGQCVNGFCSFGRCQCFKGFRGESCNDIIIAPVFATLPSDPIQLIEGGSFTYTFLLETGSLPVDFSLMGLPQKGMTITKTGLFTWDNPVASSSTVAVWVLATNELSSAKAVLYLDVNPSFYVKVSTVAEWLTRPAPAISFRVETFDLVRGRPMSDTLANLWVQRVGSASRKKILVKTDGYGRLDTFYLPYSSDAGRFVYGGEHPNYANVTAQGEFAIRGIDVSPTTSNFAGFPLESALLKDTFSFIFYGGSFTNITVTFDEVDGIEANSILSRYEGNETANTVSMSVNILVLLPLRGLLYFTLTTNEGVSVSASIALDVRDRSPKFRVSPPNIDIAVARGGVSSYHNAVLQNIGSRASGRISLVLPPQAVIRAVTDASIPGLAVDETTTVTLAFSAAADLEIGMVFTGTVGFVSNSTYTSLDYRVTVVSTVPAALTVITQNEATYFASHAPNLPEVIVRVRSLTVGTTFSELSDGNGTCLFSDLVEDLYEIVAQKLGHKTFRQEIFLAAPGKTVLAFLTTEVVSYTFSVVPVPVLDKYVIEMVTTFETRVPRPVVVFEPAVLDWEGINSGLVDEIMVTATNYGYIAAENLTFSWMTYWNNARFILPDEEMNPSRVRSLGDLPANSSTTFPVKIERIIRFDVPEDRAELRVGTNDVLFVPRADDPVWDTGPDIIVAPGYDPIDGQMYVQLDSNGTIVYVYEYATGDLHTPIYEYNETEGDFDVVGVAITRNTTLPDKSRRNLGVGRAVAAFVPNELDVSDSRGLGAVGDFFDCVRDILCVSCQLAGGLMKKLWSKGVRKVGKQCKKLEKYYPNAAVVCDKVSEFVAEELDPCELPCKDSNDITAEFTITCPLFTWTEEFSWNVPTFEGCPKPSTSTSRDVGIILGSGGGGGSCPRCGFGSFSSSGGGGGGCTLSVRIQRRMNIEPFASLPDHVIPSHRAILEGCATCSADSLKVAFQEISNMESDLLAAETALQSCVDAAISDGGIKSLFSCTIRKSLGFIRFMPLLSEVISCQLAQEPCYSSTVLSTNPGLVNLLIQARRIQTFTQLALLPFGGFVTGDTITLLNASVPSSQAANSFDALMVNITTDGSAEGITISATELESLLTQGLDLPGDADLRRFASLWNTSVVVWDDDVLDEGNYSHGSFFNLAEATALMNRFQSSRDSVRTEGFTGFGDAWLSAVEGQQLEESRKLAGICATVSVRIEQELTLTRTGFEARLDVSNNGDHRLENVSVALRATMFGNASFDATDFFVFGTPELNQMSAVDGTGRIAANSIGKATWLIMPLTEAAPEFATKYDISGILLYTIEGIEYQQYLSPDTITVMPDPQLYLTYFHSRVAYSNDPFTNGIVEPAVPFHLGLLIENRGFGEAIDVNMVTSQPEIIDNKKGLLVDFNIIGARLGNEPTSKALDINFGNIGARSNKIGIWDMISSIRGKFFNYTATFQYLGPINDDRLSLIESVEIYELTHLVRVTGDHPAMPPGGLGYYDDGLDDFLTNRLPDAFYLPDTVFTSDTRQSNFSVGAIVGRGWTEEPHLVDDSIFIVVRHNLSSTDRANLPDWVYIRFDDPMARTDFILQSVTRQDVNYTLIQQYNSWQTSWTEYLLDGSIINEDYVHLFDFGVADAYTLWYAKQQPVANLRVIDSSNSSITVVWDAAAGATASYVLVKPRAVSNQYYKVANKFLQVESCVIDGLASGTEYTIKVFTGSSGNYERIGAIVTGVTLGVGACGNSVVDAGEECDDGSLNGSPESNCTVACVVKIVSNTTTFAPSSVPSKPPSTHPTFSPTKSPSDSSTVRPTKVPTISPAQFPTKSPTEAPANLPTNPPIKEPTEPPTRSPSIPPTSSPIFTSTVSPIKPSTKLPTATFSPTKSPTNSSAVRPTSIPTKSPANIPTKAPTEAPANSPTKPPTKKPTKPPSVPPTQAPQNIPTKTPTKSPTKPPSKSPTNRPTPAPTMAPAKSPTKAPTKQPTKPPTRMPSKPPTEAPAFIPTRTPTKSPTEPPSNRPTKSPAEPSTQRPTNATSEEPTELPTGPPTKHPTNPPTKTPSISPIEAPTFIPTKTPTQPPTKPPSAAPSKIPTNAPIKPPSKCANVKKRCSRFLKCCYGTGLKCVNGRCCYPKNKNCNLTSECCSGLKCKLFFGKKRCR